jgi:hypothetical protein
MRLSHPGTVFIFIAQEGQNFLPYQQHLSSVPSAATKNLSMVWVVCDNTKAVEETFMLLERHNC